MRIGARSVLTCAAWRSCNDGSMRWLAAGLLVVVAGCAKLNGAFDDSKSSGTEGGTATGVDAPPQPATTLDATTGDSATSDGTVTTHDGTTHHDDATTDGSSSTSVVDRPDAGTEENVVVLLYAAEGWRGNSAALIPGRGALGSAVIHCMDDLDYADGCNTNIPALPLLRTDNVPVDIAPTDWALGFGPVYGLHSRGDQAIADNIADLLSMDTIEPPLAMSGVVNGELSAEGLFWSGGRLPKVGNCDNWSNAANNTFAGAGTLTVPPSADADWFDVSDESCTATLPILCACLSPADAFP